MIKCIQHIVVEKRTILLICRITSLLLLVWRGPVMLGILSVIKRGAACFLAERSREFACTFFDICFARYAVKSALVYIKLFVREHGVVIVLIFAEKLTHRANVHKDGESGRVLRSIADGEGVVCVACLIGEGHFIARFIAVAFNKRVVYRFNSR